MQLLESLKQQALGCQKCGLCQTRHHVVFGEGVVPSPVVFIGEGPGEQEDLSGRPFVGRGGQLLERYLETIDLSRSQNYYITNIVKCRPPQNRDPAPGEQDACLPYLFEQLRLLEPKIVVCLGRIAAQKLIKPDFRVTREHGLFFEREGVLWMGTFHPASLLRNPSQKPLAFSDFLNLREKIKELCPSAYSF